MNRTIQLTLGSLVLAVWALSRLAQRFPQVGWLQVFRDAWPKLSEEQKAKMRRRGNIYAGVEMILLGMVIPLGYAALTVMFFNKFTPTGIFLALASSLLLIGLGITAIVRARR